MKKRRKRVHHTHPNASLAQIIAHPMLDWERSACDCCDADRDWILDANVFFDRADDEGLLVFLVVPNRGDGAYWEYNGQRHYFDSIAEAIVDAERWARRCMREYKRQGKLKFDGSEVLPPQRAERKKK